MKLEFNNEHSTKWLFLSTISNRIEIWTVGFCGGRKFGEKPWEQGWELTKNSTHKWHKGQESNPGHSGGKQALTPLYHTYK